MVVHQNYGVQEEALLTFTGYGNITDAKVFSWTDGPTISQTVYTSSQPLSPKHYDAKNCIINTPQTGNFQKSGLNDVIGIGVCSKLCTASQTVYNQISNPQKITQNPN